jgi:hypothetical protein
MGSKGKAIVEVSYAVASALADEVRHEEFFENLRGRKKRA